MKNIDQRNPAASDPSRRAMLYNLGASLGSVAFTALLARELNAEPGGAVDPYYQLQ